MCSSDLNDRGPTVTWYTGRSGATHRTVIWPRTSSTASPTMPGQGCPRPPMGSARTWLQQQYYSERCQNHPPPRGDISRESSRISWRMPRSGGPKALPPEGKGTPRSIASRLPDSYGKPRSTPGARGTQRLRPRVASATYQNKIYFLKYYPEKKIAETFETSYKTCLLYTSYR